MLVLNRPVRVGVTPLCPRAPLSIGRSSATRSSIRSGAADGRASISAGSGHARWSCGRWTSPSGCACGTAPGARSPPVSTSIRDSASPRRWWNERRQAGVRRAARGDASPRRAQIHPLGQREGLHRARWPPPGRGAVRPHLPGTWAPTPAPGTGVPDHDGQGRTLPRRSSSSEPHATSSPQEHPCVNVPPSTRAAPDTDRPEAMGWMPDGHRRRYGASFRLHHGSGSTIQLSTKSGFGSSAPQPIAHQDDLPTVIGQQFAVLHTCCNGVSKHQCIVHRKIKRPVVRHVRCMQFDAGEVRAARAPFASYDVAGPVSGGKRARARGERERLSSFPGSRCAGSPPLRDTLA